MIQLLKILNQLAKHLIKNLKDWPWWRPEFPSRTAGLVAFPEVRAKPQKPKTGTSGGPIRPGKLMAAGDLNRDRDLHLAADRPGLPGALICGLFVTWYVVAGTAQAAF